MVQSVGEPNLTDSIQTSQSDVSKHAFGIWGLQSLRLGQHLLFIQILSGKLLLVLNSQTQSHCP